MAGSRSEQRAAARAEREARERAQALRSRRTRRLWLLAGVTVVALVLAGSAALIGHSGDGSSPASANQTQALFAGIPQQGAALGNPNAPVTLQEFADLQCPFCREYTLGALPQIVKQYVRTGKVRIVFRPLAFIGPDSVVAARVADAAAQQNRLWDFIDRFYSQQKTENTGYVTDSFLRQVGSGVPGLDMTRALQDSKSQSAVQPLTSAQQLANQFKIASTPSFVIGPTGGQGHVLEVSSLAASAFTGPIQHELTR
jgi:protein-disulfide isomerase